MEYIVKTINELCCRITDGSHYSPVEQEEGYPMYSSKDMLYDDFDDSSVKRIAKDDYDKLVKQDCKPLKDDIVIIKDGNSYLKRVFRIKKDIDAVILSSIAILRPQKMIIDPRYFAYVLRTNSVHSAMANYVSGAAIPRIVLRDFKKMKVSIHKSLEAQQKIASILSTYDTLIENNTKRIRLLEQMAENLYKEWFVRFRFPGHENVEMENGLPKGWKNGTLGDIVEFQNGFAFKSETFCEGGKFSVVTIKNVKDNGFEGNNTDKIDEIPPRMPSYCKLQEGDTLLSLTGNIGRVCRVQGDNYLLNQRVAKIKSKHPLYSYCLFKSEYIYASLNVISYGTAQLNLSPVKASKIKLAIPDKQLLERFERIADPIFTEISSLHHQNSLLTRQRDLLLPRLMSGKLEVKA